MAVPNENRFFRNLPDFEKEFEEEKRRKKIPPAPSFSLDDMEQARKGAFEKGRQEGLQIAKDALEQKTEILVQSIIANVHNLENNEIIRNAQSIDDAVSMVYKSLGKLLPMAVFQEKETLIYHALHDFFTEQRPNSDLILYVHPSMIDSVKKYVELLSTRINLQPDEKLSDTQSRMEWHGGSFEFTPDIMIEKILNVIKSNLSIQAKQLDESLKNAHNDDNISDETQTGSISHE